LLKASAESHQKASSIQWGLFYMIFTLKSTFSYENGRKAGLIPFVTTAGQSQL